MASTTIARTSLSPIRAIRCAGCGAALDIFRSRTNYFTCHYCGTVLDARSETGKALSKLESVVPPRSFIRLGKAAVFDGTLYVAIGRTRWTSNYRELDEGEYGDETWSYDEWFMAAENGTGFYLVEDDEGFTRSVEYYPKYPALAEDTAIHDFTNDKLRDVLETGIATVSYFEGESTYRVTPQDRIAFSMYRSGDVDYLVESRLDGSGAIVEVEFFTERRLAPELVAQAFDRDAAGSDEAFIPLNPATGAQQSEATPSTGRRPDTKLSPAKASVANPTARFAAKVFALCMAVCFILGIYAPFSGTVVFRGEVGDSPQGGFEKATNQANDTAAAGAPVGYDEYGNPEATEAASVWVCGGCVPVDPAGHTYRLSINLGDVPGYSDFETGVEADLLSSKDSAEIASLDAQIFRETDDEGSSSNSSASTLFGVNQNDYCKIRISVSAPAGQYQAPIRVEVRRGVLMARYFWIAFAAFAVLAIFALPRRSKV
jgi:ribosomal protein S27E